MPQHLLLSPSILLTAHQAAAGTFHYLSSFVTPSLRNSVIEEDMPLDLTEPFLGSLESLMLAQAQEGVWLHAVNGKFLRNIPIQSAIIHLLC